jgi:uncharacterized protein (DUF885 family)
MRKSALFLLAVTTIAVSCVREKSTDTTTDERFNYFKERFIEKLWELNPTSALFSGYHKYDSLMSVPDSATIKKQNETYAALLDSLKAFDPDRLSGNNKTDYRMIENQVKSALWYNKEFRGYEWNPSEYNVAGEFAQMITENYDRLDNRLRMLSKRLEKVPYYYETARKNITTPTIEHTDLAILQNRGALQVFDALLQDSLRKSSLSIDEKAAITVKADAAKKAVVDYIEWLSVTVKPRLTPSSARSFRLPKRLYEKKFEYDIVSSYSAEEVYKKAVKRKEELHREMAKISRQLWTKYFPGKPQPSDEAQLIRAVIDRITLKHVHRDSFLSAVKAQIPELVSFINSRKLIYLDPKKPLVVRETPLYMQGVAGASISSPGPYEKDANTYYNVTPLTGYSPEEAESYLREYNYYTLQILNIHEAIPGHYTQLVYSNQAESIVKSVLGNGAMVEGWAVYTERMMLEEGYGNNEPEMWLMYYKWHLRVVCNTILDYSVHVLGMSRKEGLKLLTEEAFQETAEAEGKWRRATLTQVQLCSYFTGYTEIYDLREDLKKKMGAEFDLKKFHEKFLSYGSAPVKYIRQLMLEEVKKKNTEAKS